MEGVLLYELTVHSCQGGAGWEKSSRPQTTLCLYHCDTGWAAPWDTIPWKTEQSTSKASREASETVP